MIISTDDSNDGLADKAIAVLAPLLEQGCDDKIFFEVSQRRAMARGSSDDRSNGTVSEHVDFEAVETLLKAIAPDRMQDGAARIEIPEGKRPHGVAKLMLSWNAHIDTLAIKIMTRTPVAA